MPTLDLGSPLERARRLDRPAALMDRVARTLVGDGTARAVLEGQQLGHAAHPLLVQVPIGAWVSAGWLDFLPGGEQGAMVLTGIGVAGAVPAIASGLADYQRLDRRGRRVAVVHAAANTAALTCQIVSLRARATQHRSRGIWTGLAGTLLLTLGGLLGGHLAHPRDHRPVT